ncbi:unnamed protein product [Enterobius vermicularis]|uniref:ACB domain-containing protein n=1 Tax=Enterobius vermicularis TaxID=51028 RepID=A0A0N4UXY2_ENTVE|nr:unnamed protein product [Enterobius vermicularis]
MSIDEKFDAAVKIVQKLPKSGPLTTSNDEKLKFYSLYKQATVGNVNKPKPSFYELTECSKWNAWNALCDMPKDEAKQKYVEELEKMLDRFSKEGNFKEWLDSVNDPELTALFAVFGR